MKKPRKHNQRLQKKRQKRRKRPTSRPGFVIEVQNGARYYDLLLSDPECEALKSFAASTLDVTGEAMAGKPEFTSVNAQRAFQGIARKGLVKPDPPREEGFWVLTATGFMTAEALGVEPTASDGRPASPVVDIATPDANTSHETAVA